MLLREQEPTFIQMLALIMGTTKIPAMANIKIATMITPTATILPHIMDIYIRIIMHAIRFTTSITLTKGEVLVAAMEVEEVAIILIEEGFRFKAVHIANVIELRGTYALHNLIWRLLLMDLYPIKQSKLETRSLILSPLILTQKMMM